jgi:hypothetical protein
MSIILEVDFYNSYILQENQVSNGFGLTGPGWPGPWYPGPLSFASNALQYNWYVEEGRIRGGYNNTSTDLGVRAYLDEEYPLQQNRISTLIYSGVYNSRTGINQTNVFSVGDAITKSLDPVHGSIQKTYAEETNLIVFQENRIHRALIDKDTIYTTESGTQTQAGAAVIGQFVQYKGEYGISKNPESFAIYNYRKYFADKNRNAIMRLSNDGLTEISMYGMRDYFRDKLAEISNGKEKKTISITYKAGGTTATTYVDIFTASITAGQNITPGMQILRNGTAQPGYITLVETPDNATTRIYYSQVFTNNLSSGTLLVSYFFKGQVKGGWDIHNKNYVVSLQKFPTQVDPDETPDPETGEYDSYKTIAFDEDINGWVSFFDYKPVQMFSMINKYYTVGASGTTNSTELYQQYYKNTANDTHGLFYGTRHKSNVTFVFNPQPDVMKNFNTISYEGSNGWEVTSYISGFTGQDPNPDTVAGGYVQSNDSIISIKSYDEGSYVDANTGYTLRAGFDRKENRYVANLRNNSAAATGEVLFGAQMSGIKGYFATVTIQTDGTTQLGGPKELWAAGTNFVTSSY